MTSLVTEAIKKMWTVKSNNLLAAGVSFFVSIGVCIADIMIEGITVTTTVRIMIVCVVVLSWLCAMLGYDKVVQTIKQLHTNTED